MAESDTLFDSLNEGLMTPGDLRRVADMSYRQLNEWDKREALPSQRSAEGGWRKVSVWQAMALRILAQLHRQYGVPLTKLQGLLRWVLGEAPTDFDLVRLRMAEDKLWGLSAEDRAKHNKLLQNAMKSAIPLGKDQFLLSTTGKPSLNAEHPSALSLEELIHASVRGVLPRFVQRGWEASAAESFASRFFSLSLGERSGCGSFSEIRLLLADLKPGDAIAKRSVEMLGASLVPLFEAVGLMSSGNPVLLVTDLEDSHFVTESTYLEWVNRSVLLKSSIVLRADEHINAVLSTLGKAMPITRPAERTDGKGLSPEERQILDLLRSRNFDRLSVEPKDDGYRLELERNVSVQDARELVKMLAEHDYQSLIVKTRGGKITRVSQSLSLKVGAAGERKDPAPASRKRKD